MAPRNENDTLQKLVCPRTSRPICLRTSPGFIRYRPPSRYRRTDRADESRPGFSHGDSSSFDWPPICGRRSPIPPTSPRLAIDLVHEALNRADITTTTRIVDFGAVILGLQDGSFDGSGALWRTPEREKFLLFSEPYLENRLVLVGKAGSDVSAGHLSDLDWQEGGSCRDLRLWRNGSKRNRDHLYQRAERPGKPPEAAPGRGRFRCWSTNS